MSVLVVADPWACLDPTVDATVGLVAAAQELGVAVRVCTPEDLSVVAGRVRARATPVTVGPRGRGRDHRWRVSSPWSHCGEPQAIDVADAVQLVLMRIDPPVDGRYLRTTHLLDLVEAAGTRVVNRPAGVRALQEKLVALHFPELCPATLLTADPGEVRGFVATHGSAVVKPVDGFGGRDVWLLRDDATAQALATSATGGGRRHVLVQEYLPAVQEGNKRPLPARRRGRRRGPAPPLARRLPHRRTVGARRSRRRRPAHRRRDRSPARPARHRDGGPRRHRRPPDRGQRDLPRRHRQGRRACSAPTCPARASGGSCTSTHPPDRK